jgi:hypothetical protein
VKGFIETFSIPWSCGYGTKTGTIARFGAFAPPAGVIGFEVPTLYLIGPDGRIRWNDRRARYRHEDPDLLLKELESEIERALAPQR